MAIALSVVAILVALISVGVSIWSARSSARSAEAADAVDRRERTPVLVVALDHPSPEPNDGVIYHLRNDGPHGLDSIEMFRPRTREEIRYPLARTGDPDGWSDDQVELGPLPMTREVAFTLCCGSSKDLPDFRVVVVCRASSDSWNLAIPLPNPRSGALPV